LVLELATSEMAIAAMIVVVAGLMRGFAGFGSGMLMAPIFTVLFGPIESVTMVILLEILVSVQLMPRILNDTEWRFVIPLSLSAALLMPLGAYLLASTDPNLLARAMAIVVLLFVIMLMTGWRYRGERGFFATLGVGAVSGTLMAATGMGNPPVLLYMLSGQDSGATNRANIIAYLSVTQGVLLAVLASMGMLSWPPVAKALLLTPSYALAAWAGGRLFHQSTEALYRRTALILLFGVACYGLLR
jgi:uncharacterized membrane protein YfcA